MNTAFFDAQCASGMLYTKQREANRIEVRDALRKYLRKKTHGVVLDGTCYCVHDRVREVVIENHALSNDDVSADELACCADNIGKFGKVLGNKEFDDDHECLMNEVVGLLCDELFGVVDDGVEWALGPYENYWHKGAMCLP